MQITVSYFLTINSDKNTYADVEFAILLQKHVRHCVSVNALNQQLRLTIRPCSDSDMLRRLINCRILIIRSIIIIII